MSQSPFQVTSLMAESLNVDSSSTGMSGAFNQPGPGAAGIGSNTEDRSLFRIPPLEPISDFPYSSSFPHDSDDPILSTHSRPSGYQDRRRPDSTHAPSAIDEHQVMDVGNNLPQLRPTGRALPAPPSSQRPPSYRSFVTRSTPSPIPLPFPHTYNHSALEPRDPAAKRAIPDLRSTSISDLAAPFQDDGALPWQDTKFSAAPLPQPYGLGARNNYASSVSATNANPTSMRMTSHRG